MTLMEIISDIRNKFDNKSLVSIKDYKEIIYFLNNDRKKSMTKDLLTYTKHSCLYNVFLMKLIKNKDNTDIFIKSVDEDVEYRYVLNSNKCSCN